MGIEGGSIGSVSVGQSIGPSIRGISSGIEGGFGARGGPSLDGIRGGITDLEATVPLGRIGFSIVNEGPVRGSLEGFRPMSASDISTIDKGGTVATSGLSVIEQAKAVAAKAWEVSEPLVPAEVVSQAEVIISQAQQKSLSSSHPEPGIWHLPSVTWTLPDYQPVPFVAVSSSIGLAPKIAPKTESRVSNQAAPAISPQPLLQEQEVEEIVTEKITKEETAMVEEEEIEKIKRKYVVDERALSQVVVEFKAAVRKARELAGKLGIKITGKLISKFLPGQHPGNESEVVKGKGPDGSIPERQQSVEQLGKLSSDTQTEEEVVKVAYEKPPVKISSEGESVKNEDVQRVYKDYMIKPKLIIEVISRIVKKKRLVIQAGEKAVDTPVETRMSESRIEDYPDLAEVFRH